MTQWSSVIPDSGVAVNVVEPSPRLQCLFSPPTGPVSCLTHQGVTFEWQVKGGPQLAHAGKWFWVCSQWPNLITVS